MNQKYKVPFEFILDYLHPKEINIKPMFGCFGLYVDDKIIFFLRNRKDKPNLNGVWVATNPEYYESLSKTLTSVNQELKLVEDKKSNNKWLLLSIEDDNFEEVVIQACELVLKGDERIGKFTQGSVNLISMKDEN